MTATSCPLVMLAPRGFCWTWTATARSPGMSWRPSSSTRPCRKRRRSSSSTPMPMETAPSPARSFSRFCGTASATRRRKRKAWWRQPPRPRLSPGPQTRGLGVAERPASVAAPLPHRSRAPPRRRQRDVQPLFRRWRRRRRWRPAHDTIARSGTGTGSSLGRCTSSSGVVSATAVGAARWHPRRPLSGHSIAPSSMALGSPRGR
mmetsp:Transcript_129708/g.375670  ORF Transcript_129708/g.375670 Transcript_129708/m.375670 type:complete len:204 (+) Transcript_129708:697-1308(+)